MSVEQPDPVYVRQRWVAGSVARWVRDADAIMLEHGVVVGTVVYERRYQARWRAQRLIRLMVELRLHERWELREHTEPRRGGWIWEIEYMGDRQ